LTKEIKFKIILLFSSMHVAWYTRTHTLYPYNCV
jgi:hypothetical protein